MRIGVDATSWANARGYGRFTREIVAAMVALAPADDFVCFLDPLSDACFHLDSPNVRKVVVATVREAAVRAAAVSSNRTIADMLRMTRAVRREPLDVFFSPTVYSYFPLPPGLRAVVTILDAIPERFPELTLPSRKMRLFWKLKVGLAIRQARRILTVSDHSARDLERIHGIPRWRIRVATAAPSSAYYAVAPDQSGDASAAVTRALGELPSGWFTYVGGFNPHKNVPMLIRAHAALARELGAAAPTLLLVGEPDYDDFFSDVPAIIAAIEREGTAPLVRWTGFLGDEILRYIHSLAIALVLPSDAEGFGLPAVEAAACGSPVIATRESPLPDLLSGAGFFVAPRDETGLLAAMRELATNADLHRRFSRAALEAARTLTWERGASATLAAIREAAA
jgi:glycosyltransferase involved in cell wall biosynthesis